MMRWLFPRFPLARLPVMVRTALLGAVIAAGYGAAHDQLSYAISPEYFTRFKFRQFAWANVGWPPRLYASEVGVLATWWVGLVAGWLLARAGLAELPAGERWGKTWRAFGIVFVPAVVGGLIGWGSGVAVAGGDLSGWGEWQRTLELADLPAFVVVAHLHAGGYLGALAGLVLAVVYVRRSLSRSRQSAAPTGPVES
jgi:hypothetical protein